MIPHEIFLVIEKLQKNGYATYLVGGCVRDQLLNREPSDWDIATSALPEQVKELFTDYSIYTIGEKFGTIGIQFPDNKVEITTFRKDGEYTDNRKPDSVQFSTSVEEDLSRRDFTINAIAYDPVAEIYIDPYNGQLDIRNSIIRAVGNANDRFIEDALRILRAVRFASQLNFSIYPTTVDAIFANRELLTNISWERKRDELFKMLITFYGFTLIETMELTEYLIPELLELNGLTQNPSYHDTDVFLHSLEVCRICKSTDPIVRLGALLHDIGKYEAAESSECGDYYTFHNHGEIGVPIVEKIADRLRLSNKDKQRIVNIVRYHDYFYIPPKTKKAYRKLLATVGKESVIDILTVREADCIADCPLDIRKSRITQFQVMKDIFYDVMEETPVVKIKLAISGDEIIRLSGFPQGKNIGKIIAWLTDIIMEDPEKNTVEILSNLVQRLRWKYNKAWWTNSERFVFIDGFYSNPRTVLSGMLYDKGYKINED